MARLMMRRHSVGASLLLSAALVGCQGHAASARALVCAVYFSPKGGCTEEVVSEIQNARQNILVQAYSFTSEPIAQALIEAHRRGVQVEVILDKSQRTDRRSTAGLLAHAGVPVNIDAAHAIAHNKVMVIDGVTVITGSFNFTESAEARNAENLLVVRDPTLAGRYANNWRSHRAHASLYAVSSAELFKGGR